MPKKSTPQQKRGASRDRTALWSERGKRGLTEMQKRFCEFLAQGYDQAEALRRAGSKAKNPDAIASRWSRLVKVQEYLKSIPAQRQHQQEQEEDRSARIATAQERQEFWTAVMRGEGEATFVTKEGLLTGPPDWGSRIKAADSLAKAQGDFKDDAGRVQPQVVINMPQRAMTPEEIEEARHANSNAPA